MISLDAGIFGEGLPMQDLFEIVLNRPVDLTCQQDNASVIQLVHGGYSPKLRHLKKVQLYGVFNSPDVMLQYIKSAMQRADPFTNGP